MRATCAVPPSAGGRIAEKKKRNPNWSASLLEHDETVPISSTSEAVTGAAAAASEPQWWFKRSQ